MNNFFLKRVSITGLRRLVVWLACLLLMEVGISMSVQGGDKLIISGKKTLVGPGQDKVAAEQMRLKQALEFGEAPMPYAHMPVQPQSRWRIKADKTKEEKRKEMQRAEKQNWALLEPGQLQAEAGDEYDFGVRDSKGEGDDMDIENRDYTFYGLNNAKNDSSKGAAQSHGNTAGDRRESHRRGLQQARKDMEDRNDSRRSSSHLNPFRVSNQSPTGVGLASGLANERRFNSAFDAGLAGVDSGFGRNNTANSDALSQAVKSDRDQRMESFRGILGTSPQGGYSGNSKLIGSSSLINNSPDLTRQTMNPVVGSTASRFSPSSFGAPDNNQVFNQQLNQQPAFGQPRVSGFSSLPSLDLRRRETKPNPLLEPPRNLDLPRRNF